METLIPEQRLARELTAGESLLWSGRPKQGFMLRPQDSFLIPFSLLWCGFAIFWEAGVVASGAPWFFKLWGIPFVLVGLYFVAGRFVVEAKQRARTIYGITSSRVIIISGLVRESIQSIQLRGLHDVSLTEMPDRSGTIRLGPAAVTSFFAPSWPGSSQSGPPSLEGVPEVRVVHGLLLSAQAKAA